MWMPTTPRAVQELIARVSPLCATAVLNVAPSGPAVQISIPSVPSLPPLKVHFSSEYQAKCKMVI